MDDVVSLLCYAVSLENLYNVFVIIVGLLAVSVIFALGFGLIWKIIHFITVLRESDEAYDWYYNRKIKSYNRKHGVRF